MFIGFCGQAIAVSASHIYTSALAFAPRSSEIAQLYGPRFRNLIDLDLGRLDKWPAKQIVIDTLQGSDPIKSIAFSPDGRQLVLCSDRSHFYGVSDKWNKTVRVLDVATSRFTAGLFRHTERVLSAVYSTDGKNTLYQPTEPFTYGIQSVGSIIVQSNISWFRLIKKYIALSLCVIASISPPCAVVAQD